MQVGAYITKNDLIDLGVSLEDDDFDKLLTELNGKVDSSISNEILATLSSEDAEELAKMQDKSSTQELGEWLASKIPDYEEIIEDNRDIVLGDFVDTSPLFDE